MERDNRTCRRCGSTQNVQWAHVYSRRYRAIRHDPRNSMCLCSRCHLWQTHHPLEGEAFFRELLGDEVMDELRRIALENLP
jgi:5-methylcytosine-specific restriction endonuclease McrA